MNDAPGMPNSKTKDEVKLEAFRQNWEQIRHIEKVRLSFTSFYFLIVAGTLAFAYESRPLVIALAVLSAFGALICWRTDSTALHHRERALHLAGNLVGEDDKNHLSDYVPFKEDKPKFYNISKIRGMFFWIYVLAIILLSIHACLLSSQE